MIIRLALCLVLGVAVCLVAGTPVLAAGDAVRVGFLVDGPGRGNEGLIALTHAEILTLTQGEFEVEFPPEGYRIGDWTPQTAERLLEEMLADPGVDVIITWGVMVSNSVCCPDQLPKPVIAPAVIERFPWSGHLGTRLLDDVRAALDAAGPTLLFTNTRSQAEIWFHSLLRADPPLAGAIALHHGPPHPDIRTEV